MTDKIEGEGITFDDVLLIPRLSSVVPTEVDTSTHLVRNIRTATRGLDVRAVRLGVGAALSLVFFQVVERRQPDRGDGYDQWHAIQSSAADVFVTRDDRLARLLARVPIEGFRAVTSLRDLLTGPAPTRSH